VAAAGWTLRPEDLPALIGEGAEISDRPGIVVDLVRRGGPGAKADLRAPHP